MNASSGHRTLFDCEHPIVCAPMNQVSDVGLAVAVHRAGAFPSLSLPNYLRDGQLDLAAYRKDLLDYKHATGSDNLLLSVGSSLLLHDVVTRPFIELGFRHIELFHWAREQADWPAVLRRARTLAERHGVRVLFKISTGHVVPELDYAAIVLKGPEGAGRSADHAPPLDETFARCRETLPGTQIVVSGGIGTAEQVRDYVDAGAAAIAIGSLFAASRESCVADGVKAKIIASSKDDLQVQGANRLRGLYASLPERDTPNLTRSLAAGVRSADEGAVFMGSAVDHITEVLPVAEIVARLVRRLA